MTSRHERSNRRPVRNALLKWQLQQDQARLREVQERLMRVATPSPAASLGVDGRRPTVRRLRPRDQFDPEEDALMSLLMEREEREASTSNQNEVPASRLKYPKVLPPLRRLENKTPLDTMKTSVLRPTGQKLNAAGDFYSPVRPRGSSGNNSTSDCRQSLAFSRIKAPTSKRLATAAPSPRNYDEMKTPDRWRTTAMKSNQEDLNESVVRRWEMEDAAQADRLLEKAAKEGENEALWNDLFYGTKVARAETDQQNNQQPEVYSTSSFPEVFSDSRSNSRGSSCYGDDDRPKSPVKATGRINETLLTSELSTMSTVQHSDIGSPVTDSNGATAPSSTQTIAEMFASMEKVFAAEPLGDDLVAGEGNGRDGSSGGGGDRENFSIDELSAGIRNFVQVGELPNTEFPRWSIIVVASCLVIGTGGFFIEEIMGLMGLFSKNTPFALSKAEQERMRDRVNSLQQELQGFQHSTSEVEVKSHTVLTELQRYMNRMQLDREKHQDMLATEMQELRRHILGVTHELVQQERESIQSQLQELVKVHVINDDNNKAITGIDVETYKESEISQIEEHEETVEQERESIQSQTAIEEVARSELVIELSSDSSPDTHSPQLDEERRHDQVIVPAPAAVGEAASSREPSVHVDVSAETKRPIAAVDQVQITTLAQAIDEAQLIDQGTEEEFVLQASTEQIKVEHVLEVEIDIIPAEEAVYSHETPVLFDTSVQTEQLIAIADHEQVTTTAQPIVEVQLIDHATPAESAFQASAEHVKIEHAQEAEIDHKINVSVTPAPKVTIITKPPRSAPGMSWDGILLLIGVMFLAACVLLRVYNINHRQKWFKERRKRRHQRAQLLAEQRARRMAASQDDSDEWNDDDSIEEISLMTPVRDSEDDEPTSEQQVRSPDVDTDVDDQNDDEHTSSTAEAYRAAPTERISSTRTKTNHSRRSILQFRQRSPRRRQPQKLNHTQT